MEQFLAWLSKLFDSWKFWIVIPPWDTGVRVRLGRNAVAMGPGFHFRVPFLDVITLINTRLRIDGTPPITVSGSALNRTRYISASIGFRIANPLLAMLRYGAPGPVVISRAQCEIAATKDDCQTLERMRAYFGEDSGIEIEFVTFVEDVEVKTYRLIQGTSYAVSGHEGPSPINAREARY